jgi:hypothetical protein
MVAVMNTLALDFFTKEATLFLERANKESNAIRKTSFIGVANRLLRKRDSLSIILFGVKYEEAISKGLYEPWIF